MSIMPLHAAMRRARRRCSHPPCDSAVLIPLVFGARRRPEPTALVARPTDGVRRSSRQHGAHEALFSGGAGDAANAYLRAPRRQLGGTIRAPVPRLSAYTRGGVPALRITQISVCRQI